MSTNPCRLSDDIGAVDCAPFAAGGNAAVYIANREDVTPTYDNTYPQGAVTALTFATYTRLYEAQALLDTPVYEAPLVRENGLYRYDNTLTLQFNANSSALYDNLREALGSKLIAIVKGNNDRFYILGLGARGLIVDSWTDTSGQAPTDAREFVLTLSGTDTRGAYLFTTDTSNEEAGFLGAQGLIDSYLALPTQ